MKKGLPLKEARVLKALRAIQIGDLVGYERHPSRGRGRVVPWARAPAMTFPNHVKVRWYGDGWRGKHRVLATAVLRILEPAK